jgi:hypothetical protein
VIGHTADFLFNAFGDRHPSWRRAADSLAPPDDHDVGFRFMPIAVQLIGVTAGR